MMRRIAFLSLLIFIGSPITSWSKSAALPSVDKATDKATPRKSLPDKSSDQPKKTRVAAKSSAKPVKLTTQQKKLSKKINNILDINYHKHLDSATRGPWAIMHAIVAFGVDTQIHRGPQGAPKVTAIGWLCYNAPSNGQTLFSLTGDEKISLHQGPGVQGHHGQFLAILAQSRVKSTYPVRVGGKKFTVADIIEYEKRTCQAGTELTFKLIGLVHYLKSDETWTNESGDKWSIERLIKEELKQPVIGAACGGTHRLEGFGYAVSKRRNRGEKMTGQWARAEKYVKDFQKYTFKLQNSDGSFSTNWFESRGASGDLDERLWSTGHTLEWLMLSLEKKELNNPKVTQAVEYLTNLLSQRPHRNWKVGPLGHALHALALYDQRLLHQWQSPLVRNAKKKKQIKKKSVKTSQHLDQLRRLNNRIAKRPTPPNALTNKLPSRPVQKNKQPLVGPQLILPKN